MWSINTCCYQKLHSRKGDEELGGNRSGKIILGEQWAVKIVKDG